MVRFSLLTCLVVALVLGLIRPVAAADSIKVPDALAKRMATDVQPLVTKFCAKCHSGAKPKADLSFDKFRDAKSMLGDRDAWESVIDNIDTQVMPPEGSPKPSAEERQRMIGGVRALFDFADATARPDPGRVTIRRLNRTEYNNTIRDLMFVDFDAGEDFPSDDVGHGFDNIGDVLTLSPVLMERYLAAAEGIVNRAITPIPPKPVNRRIGSPYLQPASSKVINKNRFRQVATDETENYLSGPLFTDYKTEPDNDYVFRFRAYAETESKEPVKIAVLASGKQLKDNITEDQAERLSGKSLPGLRPCVILETVEIKARKDKEAKQFEVKFHCPEGVERIALAVEKPAEGEPATKLFVEFFSLEGPLDSRPSSQRKLLACATDKPHAEQSREVLTRFTSRAFRRPATTDEIKRLLQIVEQAEKGGAQWEAAMQQAMMAVLASPKFLFRVELDDQPQAAGPHKIDEFQLASRLSYFLWSSMPDYELFALANQGKLTAHLDDQVRRMLASPKSSALVDNFALQWLQLRRLSTFAPDAKLFPKFNERLRAAMFTETSMLLQEVVGKDRSILDLIAADYTFLNEPLAQHYGIVDTAGNTPSDKKKTPGGQPIRGQQFVRVALKDGNRGGLLTQASILSVTSNPTRTSPVKRGRWLLEQLLGAPPPPPPPNVPELKEDEQSAATGSLRQRLEQHRQNPSCASCHARMDPLGFALENYNAIGAFRQKEGEFPIDASGTLPDGTQFSGPIELKGILLQKKDVFSRCLAEKMLIYALGRGLERSDRHTVDKIVAGTAKNDYKFSSLVTEIVRSDPFRLRRGKEQQ
jgi:hypothetical protein